MADFSSAKVNIPNPFLECEWINPSGDSRSSHTSSINDSCWDKHWAGRVCCSLCFQGELTQGSQETNRMLVWKPFILAGNCEARLMCANTSDFQPEQVRAWPPPFFPSKLTVLRVDSFYCGILWHRMCMVTWGVLLCGALPNPLQSVKGLKKICFQSYLVLLGNLYLVMQQLSYCCWSTLQLHSS